METPPSQVPDANSILQSVKEPLDNLSLRNRVGLSTVLADPDTTTSRYYSYTLPRPFLYIYRPHPLCATPLHVSIPSHSHPDVTVAAPTAENLLCGMYVQINAHTAYSN